jgi:hypothetical protein
MDIGKELEVVKVEPSVIPGLPNITPAPAPTTPTPELVPA